MTTLYLDLESYCTVPIENGTYAYVEKAEVMLVPYAWGDGPVHVADMSVLPGTPVRWKDILRDMVEGADIIVMHNGGNFDRNVLKYAMGIDIPPERIHDTMVIALAHGLPGGLGPLCELYKIPTDLAKDKEGRRYIHLFCKPTKEGKRNDRHTHPKEWEGFVKYAGKDISAMRELYRKIPRWNYPVLKDEFDLWCLDQRINDRGFRVDVELAHAAIQAVGEAQDKLSKRTQKLTNDEVSSTRQRNETLKHILKAYGVDLPDLTMSTVERRLNDPELPLELKELLMIRLQASTSSTAKYKSLVKGVSRDGRLRGTLQYCGASRTGRWSGRTFQPQNLPRPALSQPDIDFGIGCLKRGIADLAFRDVMQVASSCIRGAIVAPDSRKLVVCDLSNIEGRVAAWLAGERWKLDAFRAFDEGNGEDLYKLAYARAFRVDAGSVTKEQRQVGKVMELMLQYQGGVGAFITGAASYGIDLDRMAEAALPSIPADVKGAARAWLHSEHNKQGDYGLSERAFVACDSLKRMWRAAQPNIEGCWEAINNAAKNAILNAEFSIVCGCIFRRDGSWFRIILPSGRSLCYASPQIESDGRISYMGINQYSRKWSKIYTYGGKLFENITQAVARDVMAHGMAEAEKWGYQVVLTVHDELLTETPDDRQYGAKELAALVASSPTWAQGLPLAAAGYESTRYKKE